MDNQLLELFRGLNSQIDIKARFITPRQIETNHLEFKEKSDPRVADLSKDDKKNFAKVLSSLSNAEGGVLNWGIRTRTRDERDYAAVLKPIKQVEVFAERLRSSLIDVLMPQNPGVRIEAIANRLGNGYVKCFVPESGNPPHRSMVDREYWIRLDGRSVRMEHYLIRDMMARHTYPDLELYLEHEYLDPDTDRLRISVILENTGRAVAKYTGWLAAFDNARIVGLDPGVHDNSGINEGRVITSWNAQNATVIHPNNTRVHVGQMYLEPIERTSPIAVHVTWYCEHSSTKTRDFIIPAHERPDPTQPQTDS